MSEFDGVAYLLTKGYRGRPTSGPEVVYPCFLDCGEAPDSKKKKLYYNSSDGYYYCQVCNAYGGTYTLQRHFGDTPTDVQPSGPDPLVRRKILREATTAGAKFLAGNDDVLLYLMDERGLSPETIIEAELGFVQKPWSLSKSTEHEYTQEELGTTGLIWRDGPNVGRDAFFQHILIPYHSRGGIVQIRGRQWDSDRGGKYMTGPGDAVLLYNVDSLADAEDAIITEGEFDSLVLRQHLSVAADNRARKFGIVGLAGTGALPDNFASYFQNVKRVFLGLDPDDAGRRAAAKIKEMLGSRARILELPPELPKCDWSEYLLPCPMDPSQEWLMKHPHHGHTWHDVMALVGNAAGKRVFSIAETAAEWRRQELETERIFTGFKALDQTIGGMKPGQVMVILAKTGTGKTVLLCNMTYNMRKHRVFFVSLEMTRVEAYNMLRRVYLFHNPRASDATMERDLANVFICDENMLKEHELAEIIEEFEIESGGKPEVLMVDYLGYYSRGAKGNSQYEKVTNAVMQLKTEAKRNKMVVITPGQVNRGGISGKPIEGSDARDSGAVEETADFVVTAWKPDDAMAADSNAVHTGVLMFLLDKSRHGGKGRQFGMLFDSLTLAVVDKAALEAKAIHKHNQMYSEGMTYEDLRRSQQVPVQTELETGNGVA